MKEIIMLDKLNKDMIEAMKAKDKDKLTVIRMVKAAIKQEVIDHKKEENDDLLAVVVSEDYGLFNCIMIDGKPAETRRPARTIKTAVKYAYFVK